MLKRSVASLVGKRKNEITSHFLDVALVKNQQQESCWTSTVLRTPHIWGSHCVDCSKDELEASMIFYRATDIWWWWWQAKSSLTNPITGAIEHASSLETWLLPGWEKEDLACVLGTWIQGTENFPRRDEFDLSIWGQWTWEIELEDFMLLEPWWDLTLVFFEVHLMFLLADIPLLWSSLKLSSLRSSSKLPFL